MDNSKISMATPYPDVNTVLISLAQGIERILESNLIGLYLSGSLSYGDFNPGSSDIDLVAVLRTPASANELSLLRELHSSEAVAHPAWAERLECSYTPIAMFSSTLPPGDRPYYGEGIFYPDATYGNEWIINQYLLYMYGIALIGPDFKTLTASIPIVEVQKACIRDLFREWEPKLANPAWLENPHYQSYIVLNLCRILYTVISGTTGSKTVSAAWAKSAYAEWTSLIQTAENWHYGIEMNQRAETLAFIEFTIGTVTATELYRRMQSETA